MIGTLQALLVALLAVLPGALYTIARENSGASWAWRSTDGVTLIFRFLSFSAVFHALFAPLSYYAYRRLIVNPVLANGWPISWRWYALLLVYMALPALFGAFTEMGRRRKGVSWLVALWDGRDPELRAWDWFFSKRSSKNPKKRLTGIIRMRLMNDEWKAGLWADSYASSYGEEGDLYLTYQYLVSTDGVLVEDANGDYIDGGAGLLIRWSEIRYIEFSPWIDKDDKEENGDGRGFWRRKCRKPTLHQ
jgi:hypothetical protein